MLLRKLTVFPSKLCVQSRSNLVHSLIAESGYGGSSKKCFRLVSTSARRDAEAGDGNPSSNQSASSETPDSGNDHRDERYQSIREQILSEALNFVPELGWSKEALAEGAKKLGYPKVAHGMFPEGGVELVNHFYDDCNKRLVVHMRENALPTDRNKNQVTEMIGSSVRVRLEMITPHLNIWPQALAMMAAPSNVEQSLKNLYTLVDDVWYHAGDRSVNSNFYVRRLGLASLYTSTELVLVQDKSPDFAETWDFLQRHLRRMEWVGESVKKTGIALNGLPQFLSGTLTTIRNVAGLRIL